MKINKADGMAIMSQKIQYKDVHQFLHCQDCLGKYLEDRKNNNGLSTESPRDKFNYEFGALPFTYPDGTTANILSVWCKTCGKSTWDSRHLTHLF